MNFFQFLVLTIIVIILLLLMSQIFYRKNNSYSCPECKQQSDTKNTTSDWSTRETEKAFEPDSDSDSDI